MTTNTLRGSSAARRLPSRTGINDPRRPTRPVWARRPCRAVRPRVGTELLQHGSQSTPVAGSGTGRSTGPRPVPSPSRIGVHRRSRRSVTHRPRIAVATPPARLATPTSAWRATRTPKPAASDQHQAPHPRGVAYGHPHSAIGRRPHRIAAPDRSTCRRGPETRYAAFHNADASTAPESTVTLPRAGAGAWC